ncbi:MAG: glycosyltransferase family 2 protein [Chloroflexota bacterium]
MTASLTLVIPAYCEAESLPGLLPEVLAYAEKRDWQVIVIDDGSSDDTPRILERFSQHPNLVTCRHKVNRGYGAAIKTGLRAAQSEFVITIDADGQHKLSSVETMFNLIQSQAADMIVGNRLASGSRDAYRSLGKWIIRSFARLVVPMHIKDLNSGCKIYRTALVKKYLSLCPDSMAFSDVITLVMIHQGCLVLETPIETLGRQAGKSKIRLSTAFETIIEILHIAVLLKPMRIFLPLAMLSITIGFLWGIPFILMGRGVSVGSMLALVNGMLLFSIGLISEQIAALRRQIAELGHHTPDE